MQIGSVKPGDIVLVDKKGRRFHALVAQPGGGGLDVRPIDSRISYRHASSREVVGIWHANKHTRERVAA